MTKKSCVYRMYDESNVLLYVGCSAAFFMRLASHASSTSWMHQVTKIEVSHHSSQRLALKAEAKAIKDERPKYNKAHNGDRGKQACKEWLQIKMRQDDARAYRAAAKENGTTLTKVALTAFHEMRFRKFYENQKQEAQ